MEFPGAVKGRGVVINVIVNVALVGMCADKKLVFAFRPAHRRFIADFICLLRRHLAGRERLPDLEEQGPALHGPGRFRLDVYKRQVIQCADQQRNNARDRILLHQLADAFRAKKLIGIFHGIHLTFPF